MTRIGTRQQRAHEKDQREPPPARVKAWSKLELGDAQRKRWKKSDQQALKALYEEFGLRSFSLEDADECGYLDMAEAETSVTLQRLVACGWYTLEDGEYTITDKGRLFYDEL